MASLGALLVPAAAGAATKTPAPRITSISPRILNVGDRLTVHGKYFRRGRHKDTIVFQRDGGRAVFVKADLATTRLIYLTIPSSVGKALAYRGGVPVATRFHLRIMTSRLGKKYTGSAVSPLIGPRLTTTKPGSPRTPIVAPKPPAENPKADCDGDGIPNSVDTDDDNDLLPDTVEVKYGLNPCSADTDGDGVSDGFEFQSALDLNDDDFQHPNGTVPYPGKRAYPNPLDASDADTDFDGDGLTLGIEYRLWRYSIAHNGVTPSLDHLSYSDGLKYSIYTRDAAADNRRVPALPAVGYSEGTHFLNWATAHGYADVQLPDDPGTLYALTDFNRDGVPAAGAAQPTSFYDTHGELAGSAPDGYLSDDERDEDGDGLSNYFEATGSLEAPSYWSAVYPGEPAFNIDFAGTQVDEPDSDGDGVLDGADDQDHDGYPNVVEASRKRIAETPLNSHAHATQADVFPQAAARPWGRVNPFNPCLPDTESPTCPTYLPADDVWAPFENNDVNYMVFN